MDQMGLVTKIYDNKAKVIVKRTSACGDKCTSCEGSCNVPGTIVEMENTVNAKSGDYVEINMSTTSVLRSAFLVYVMPLILMVASIVVGINISTSVGINNGEVLGVILGFVSLAISFFLLRFIDNYIKEHSDSQFEMGRIISYEIYN